MRWRQFFTPVKSIDANQARKLISDNDPKQLTILDVRQPAEYEQSHIPGARLMPLPELNERLKELDPKIPTVVYCAVGGRSRVAAQMLNGNNFEKIFNLAGGMKAWNGEAAVGPQDQGLSVFKKLSSAKQSLLVAYSMEQGLRDYYLTIMDRVADEKGQNFIQKTGRH